MHPDQLGAILQVRAALAERRLQGLPATLLTQEDFDGVLKLPKATLRPRPPPSLPPPDHNVPSTHPAHYWAGSCDGTCSNAADPVRDCPYIPCNHLACVCTPGPPLHQELREDRWISLGGLYGQAAASASEDTPLPPLPLPSSEASEAMASTLPLPKHLGKLTTSQLQQLWAMVNEGHHEGESEYRPSAIQV